MNRTSSILRGAALAAVLCLTAWSLAATPASAELRVGACVRTCMEAGKVCAEPIRAQAVACREEAGCAELFEPAREACSADRESEECAAARAAIRECIAPCKAAQREGLQACREGVLSCLRDECGLDQLPMRCARPPRDLE